MMKYGLDKIVRHETRHMIVQYLKDTKKINLTKYTENIAYENDEIYNNLFDTSIRLLKERND